MSGFLEKTGISIAVAVIMAAVPFGCSNDDGPTQNTSAKAALVVSFDPNPAPVVDYGEFLTTIYVQEINGVGVYIHEVIREAYSAAGEPYRKEMEEGLWFNINFRSCGGQGAYIEPGGVRCLNILFYDFRNFNFEDWTFRGEDDFGNQVSSTGRVYMGAVTPEGQR